MLFGEPGAHITSQKDISLLPPELVNETRRYVFFVCIYRLCTTRSCSRERGSF